MSEDPSVQILSQTSDNIQKLFDLATRIDEQVKAVQSKQQNLDDKVVASHSELMQTVTALKYSTDAGNISKCKKDIAQLDKRLSTLEHTSQGMESRWSQIVQFTINTIWLVMGAYLLFKLGLQPPAVP